ncbi:MAG: long-chain fatty acid--CoA ligase [Ruminococcaceae bacterium]|nr:long-chain fatty acid--CoA ligase [Oscillospiraceae bacterium]
MKYSIKNKHHVYPQLAGLADLLPRMEARGDHTLFKYPKGKEFVCVSNAEFAHMIRSVAAGLDAAGLAGKRIAIIGETSPEWVASYIGIITGGGVAIPMDKELAISEVEGFLSGVNAEAIIYSASFNEKLAATKENHPTLKKFIPLVGEADEKTLPFADLLAAGATALENGYVLPERDHEALATMLFTSGTTGTSKCVMLAEKNTCACVNAACATVDFCDQDVILSVLPIHHTYELAIMIAAIQVGITIGINDSLRHLMRNVAEIRPTGLILVPLFVSTIYKKIMDKAKKQGKDGLIKKMIPIAAHLPRKMRRKLFSAIHDTFGGRLEKIICGGAALNPELVKTFDAFGIQICEGYGITECSPLIAVNRYFANKPGSVGPAVPGCEARIAATGKNDLGFDEGEIQAKGDNVMMGYYNNDEANAGAFTEDGWYRTGDVGYIDRDGCIHITGRLKSVIVLESGKNVFPEEIEEYLEDIEEIAESVVVGRKQEGSDTVLLTAVVYPNKDAFPEGTDKDTMYKAIYDKIMEQNKRVASFKKIMALELRDEEFEKTTSRKIKRHLVK